MAGAFGTRTSGATHADALATAQLAANQSLEAAGAAVQRAQYGSIDNLVCPMLLQARAQVIARINALIAQFPSLSARLTATKDAAVASIDARLARFGCTVPAPSG